MCIVNQFNGFYSVSILIQLEYGQERNIKTYKDQLFLMTLLIETRPPVRVVLEINYAAEGAQYTVQLCNFISS